MDVEEELIARDRRDIKRNITVMENGSGVYVYAVAVSLGENRIHIPAVMGDPIGKCCYDMIRDVFYVRGDSYHSIGYIPVNYKLWMDEAVWDVDVPLPPSVIKRHMTKEQLEKFKAWRSMHKSHEIEYFQLVNVF